MTDIATPLDTEQIARAAALKEARAIGRNTTGPFSSTPPDVFDTIRLARFILTGKEDDDTIALEPQVLEASGGEINVHVDVFTSTTDPDVVSNAIVDAIKIDVQRVMEERGHADQPGGTLPLVLQAIEDARPVQPLTVEDAQRAATSAINAGRSAQVRRSLREMGVVRVSNLDSAEVPEFLRRIEPSEEASTDAVARPSSCGGDCCR